MHRRQLRHAHARHDARGANGTGADAHFHRIRARFCQVQRRRRRGNVAADNLHIGEGLLHPFHTVNHALAVPVRRVHHQHIHARFHQRPHARFGFAARAHRRAHAQTPLAVFVGIGKLGVFNDVFHRNQAFELVLLIQNKHAFDFMPVHQFACFFNTRANGHGNQFFARGHNSAHGQIQARFKTQIAVGNNADYLAVFYHRQARHFALALLALRQQIANQFIGRHGNRVFHHAAFMAFHLADRQGLLFNGHVFVNDADAAFLRHRNRQARLGNRVHGGRQQGQV